MPAIRAIYFSTRALEKKRGSIFEKRPKLNRAGRIDPLKVGAKRLGKARCASKRVIVTIQPCLCLCRASDEQMM
jgi:hypothetical protein